MKRNNKFKGEDKENDFQVFMEYPVKNKQKRVNLEQQFVVPWEIVRDRKKVEL